MSADLLARGLDERDERRRQEAEAEAVWLRERAGVDAAERLQSWDRWVRRVLAETLVWPEEEGRRARLIAQCAAELQIVARHLRGRGWLLDGKALASHVHALLAPVAKAQRAGAVGDFWPYFRAAVSRYVGAHAEDIQREAKRTGADEGTLAIGSLLGGLSVIKAARDESMVELLTARAGEVAAEKGESLRVRQARVRAAEAEDAARKSAAQELRLL